MSQVFSGLQLADLRHRERMRSVARPDFRLGGARMDPLQVNVRNVKLTT